MKKKIGRLGFEGLLYWKVTPAQRAKIMIAYDDMKEAHYTEFRDDGARYFEHPQAVVLILIQEFCVYDADMLIAALLHDVPEDTYLFGDRNDPKSWNVIANIFGSRVADLIRAVTREHGIPEEEKNQHARSIVESGEADIQLIKLADRLHNLRTLAECSEEKQRRVLKESVEIYLPCAQRIGGLAYEKFREECEAIQRRLSEKESS